MDLVLTDVADAERIAKQAGAAPTHPTVLPVMFEPSKEEAKAVEARYNCRLTSCGSSRPIPVRDRRCDEGPRAERKKKS